jgi:hypothetical protein
MMVSAVYAFDQREHYRALRAMMRYNPVWWLIPALGIGLPAIALWAFVIRDWDRLSLLGVVINGAPWIALGAFYLTMPWLMARTFARRAIRDDPSVRGEQIRTVSPEGLVVRGANLLQRFPWADIVRAVETPEFFLFFYNRRAAHYIPKRALMSADLEALRTLLDSHTSSRKHRAAPA